MSVNPPAGTAQVDVWIGDVNRLPAAGTSALLSDAERTRSGEFRSEPARELFIASRALQRALGSRYLGRPPEKIEVARQCQLCDDPHHGRPFLVDADGLEYSVSHSGTLVVIAYSRDCRVGLDTEQVDRRLDVATMKDRVLAPEEAREVTGSDAQRRAAFLRLWTRKEAVLKLTGHGLSVPLADVVVNADEAHVAPRPDGWPDDPIWLTDLTLTADYLASLASTATRPAVTVKDAVELF
ncbi:MAG: 4'-phosphopantetheinyl transferase superfamily protein [Actinocatenispora sp.]